MDIKIKAARAKALLNDEHFHFVMKDLRQRQVDVFVNSAPHQVEQREEAHVILRALGKIEEALQSDVDAGVLLDKKGQHRGND